MTKLPKKTEEESGKVPQVNVASSVFTRAVFRKFLLIFVYLFLAVVVIYACFAATLMRALPVAQSPWFIPVKNTTWEGDAAPKGSLMVVNMESEQGDSTFDKLRQAFWLNDPVAVVEVHAGPIGQVVQQENGSVLVDGVEMPGILKEKHNKKFLENEYFVTCVSGDCVPGEGSIVGKNQVYGEPLFVEQFSEGGN